MHVDVPFPCHEAASGDQSTAATSTGCPLWHARLPERTAGGGRRRRLIAARCFMAREWHVHVHVHGGEGAPAGPARGVSVPPLSLLARCHGGRRGSSLLVS